MRGGVARKLVALLVGASSVIGVFAPLPLAPAQAATVNALALLKQLKVLPNTHQSDYNRDFFTLWVDANGNGCNTRAEVLKAESLKPVLSHGTCTVDSGKWLSRYDGLVFTQGTKLDIDHLVPLAEAWRSGAWHWTSSTREAYANDLGSPYSLIAVSATTNRSKGDQDPATWLPPATAYRCTYEALWVATKWRWNLAVDSAEAKVLKTGLTRCGAAARVASVAKAAVRLANPTDWTSQSNSASGAGGGQQSSGGLDPRFSTCKAAKAAGYGPYVKGVDPEYYWYRDADNDGQDCQ
jgi:hypothetical protein